MGLFADVKWVDGSWVAPSAVGAHELSLNIHDSDIAVVSYAPAPTGRGVFYLGYEPADYFEDPSASDPVDHDAEAQAFSTWARAAVDIDVPVSGIRELMAEPGSEPEDVFVEETAQRLLGLLGLTLPEVP